jgi:hypothetical protein
MTNSVFLRHVDSRFKIRSLFRSLKERGRWRCWASLFLLLFCACSAPKPKTQDPAPFPARPAYILVSQNVANGFENNALVIFDAEARAISRKIDLPHSWAKNFSRDPQGRIWIGFSGDSYRTDNRVQIYSPQGQLIKMMRVADNPSAGISFAANRAFITCAENGFKGKVSIVKLDTLEIENQIEIGLNNNASLTLLASAADEQTLVIAGLTSGADEASYSVVTIVDPQKLTVIAQSQLGKNTDVWRILPHNGNFYLLNVGSYRQPRDHANDILVLTPGTPPVVKPMATAASPLWGAIYGEMLYAYHNPTWNSVVNDSHRRLSALNLQNGSVKIWDLPNDWDASDLTFLAGRILLTKGEIGEADDGLFYFDPVTGQIDLLLRQDDATQTLGAP